MTILKKIDHIGIVVDDLQSAIDELSRLLGLECKERIMVDDSGIQIAFYGLEGGCMELIEFRKPVEGIESIVTQPRSGVQHLAFQVEDLEKAVKELMDKGMRLVEGFPRKGAHGLVAFFYPTNESDLMIEICQPKSI